MLDIAKCNRCGKSFKPKREAQRFCSPACRKLAWETTAKASVRRNRANKARPKTGYHRPPRKRSRWMEFDDARYHVMRDRDGRLVVCQLVGQVWRPRWHYCAGMMRTPNGFGGYFVKVGV